MTEKTNKISLANVLMIVIMITGMIACYYAGQSATNKRIGKLETEVAVLKINQNSILSSLEKLIIQLEKSNEAYVELKIYLSAKFGDVNSTSGF